MTPRLEVGDLEATAQGGMWSEQHPGQGSTCQLWATSGNVDPKPEGLACFCLSPTLHPGFPCDSRPLPWISGHLHANCERAVGALLSSCVLQPSLTAPSSLSFSSCCLPPHPSQASNMDALTLLHFLLGNSHRLHFSANDSLVFREEENASQCWSPGLRVTALLFVKTSVTIFPLSFLQI